MWRCVLLAILVVTGCRGAGGAQALDIGVNLALAATVAAGRRASGDCYVPCDFGTYCDTSRGTCEPLPCHGACHDDEICDGEGLSERCIPAAMTVAQPLDAPPPSAAPSATTAPAVQPSRDDVPSASPTRSRSLQP